MLESPLFLCTFLFVLIFLHLSLSFALFFTHFIFLPYKVLSWCSLFLFLFYCFYWFVDFSPFLAFRTHLTCLLSPLNECKSLYLQFFFLLWRQRNCIICLINLTSYYFLLQLTVFLIF